MIRVGSCTQRRSAFGICHTPEHPCVLVSDGTRGAELWFVLTGQTLMEGDLGRTELAASAGDGAIFRSSIDAARIRAVNAGFAVAM